MKRQLRKLKPDETQKIGEADLAQARAMEQSETKLQDLVKNEPSVRRVVRRAARLADRLTEADREQGLTALRNALKAENVVYDGSARKLVRTPDSKTQLAALTLMLAYDEGLAVKRIVTMNGNFEGAGELLERFRGSPEMLKAIQTVRAAGVEVITDEGAVIDVEVEVQKTGEDSGDESQSNSGGSDHVQ